MFAVEEKVPQYLFYASLPKFPETDSGTTLR